MTRHDLPNTRWKLVYREVISGGILISNRGKTKRQKEKSNFKALWAWQCDRESCNIPGGGIWLFDGCNGYHGHGNLGLRFHTCRLVCSRQRRKPLNVVNHESALHPPPLWHQSAAMLPSCAPVGSDFSLSPLWRLALVWKNNYFFPAWEIELIATFLEEKQN